MLGWFLDTPHWIRALIALILLGIATAFYLGGRIWFWGWAVGGIMLVAAIPSGGQKSRY